MTAHLANEKVVLVRLQVHDTTRAQHNLHVRDASLAEPVQAYCSCTSALAVPFAFSAAMASSS